MVQGADHEILRGKRILVVEDEMLIALLFEDILADFECAVVGPALKISPALEWAQTADIDAAILDVNIGGDSSFPVADILRQRGVPLVFASGYGSVGLPSEWQDRPVLPKPFVANDVADVLSSVLTA